MEDNVIQKITQDVIGIILLINNVAKSEHGKNIFDCTDEELFATQEKLQAIMQIVLTDDDVEEAK